MSLPRPSPQVQRARAFLKPPSESGGLWDYPRLAGRLVEVSEEGCFGVLSALCGLMVQVQARGEQIAWIETGTTVFFPPDLAFRGLDVEAISVIQLPQAQAKAGLQAADVLSRSGAFGLIVLNWVSGEVDEAVLGRLARLAEDRSTIVLFLTRKKPEMSSLGSQIALRGVVSRTSAGETIWEIVRDKSGGPTSRQKVTYHGPLGLY